MRRARIEQEDSGQDSFLDVVANVVGVLIILVMLVGVQASHSIVSSESKSSLKTQEKRLEPADSLPGGENIATLRLKLQKSTQQAKASQRAIEEVATRVISISNEAKFSNLQRIKLAMHRSVIEEDLQQRRADLDTQRQREFDVQRELVESELKLQELNQEQMSLISAPPASEEIECIPTPLAKTVEGKAIHLRVSNGLVSIVPLEEMLEEVQFHVEDIRRRLRDTSEVVQVIGPINGYRLRLTVAKRYAQQGVVGPRLGEPQRIVLEQYAEFIPTADEIGQNVEQSLLPGGDLHNHLQKNGHEKPPVVVWLYTDSFDDFRPLKRTLWEMGFALATRPMRPGMNIGASPHGTKAAAQ